MPQDISKVLEDLHDQTAENLLNLLRDEDCTAADVRNAITFLKNNGIDLTTRKVKHLSDELIGADIPFEPEEAQC